MSRRTALMVPAPSKCSARGPGTVSIARFHVPWADWVAASIKAGRYVSGRLANSGPTWSPRRATSATERYWIGAPALASTHSSGNATGLAGGAGEAVAVAGTDCGGGDALGVAGTVTLALRLKAPA